LVFISLPLRNLFISVVDYIKKALCIMVLRRLVKLLQVAEKELEDHFSKNKDVNKKVIIKKEKKKNDNKNKQPRVC